MDNLKKVFTSKKFYAAIVALVLAFLGPRAGINGEQLTQAIQVIVAYIIGQGLADIRKA